MLLTRPASLAAVLLALTAALGCGSSTSTSTAPSPLVRCSLTLNVGDQTLPSTGGSGAVGVAATRECTWTVTVEGSWLSLRSPESGQGDGTVEFAAAPNPDPALRRGALVLNGQRADITQAAALCDISLAESSAGFTPAGGSGRVDVRASSALCPWSASSDQTWILIRSGAEGRGSAAVTFDVQPTTGPPRAGTMTIAGQRFSVTQSEGCTYTIAPAATTAPSDGRQGTVAITTTAACPWTASSNVSWLTFSQALGAGPGAVSFTVLPTQGPARTGTAVIAGHVFAVTQSAGCAYDVQPSALSVASAGGTASVSVSAANGCPWTASSSVPWITIQGASSGSGAGSISFAVAPTNGPARSGTLTVAGRSIPVSQGQGCAYSISPSQETVASAGGSGRVTVTAAAGCAWTASSSEPWISITAGASGSGPGAVQYTAAGTSGPARSGTMTIAGQTFTVNQGQGCTFSISPTQETAPAAGGGGTVNVTAADGCGWSASSNVPWIAITSGGSGIGRASVQYTVASTTGPARTGTMTVAGQTFTVNQGQGCSFAIAPAGASVPDAGGQTSFDVQTSAGCGWTAASQAPWISVTSGASGNGSSAVQLTVAANTGPSRSGAVTAADKTFTVTQGSGCSFALSSSGQSAPAAGGNGSVGVSAPAGCGWTATSNAPWLTITAGASGYGNDNVAFAAAANAGASRSGTLTIAGHTFTVTQAEACTFAIAPEQQAVGAAGGPATVTVTATAGCGWTAASNAPWITVTSNPAGTGNGTVELAVAANTEAARTGTATIAGRTFTVTQGSGCTFSVAPETIAAAAAGGPERISVTTAAGCAWTASSGETWIGVIGGSNGSGNADLSIAANTGPARSGTATIAGRTVTVNQGSGCTISVNPASFTIPQAGGPGSISVTAGGGCAWAASTTDSWIAISSPASGTGDGTVQFTVEARTTGAARTGTIQVGNRSVNVEQQ